MTVDPREEKRREFRPPKIRVLFIGESLPAEKTTFFYYANGSLYAETIRAFERTYGKSWGTGDSFLTFFK